MRTAKLASVLPFWPTGLLLGKAWFSDWAYQYEYPDVASAGIDPWRHFLTRGYKEGRRPSPLFDAAYYLSTNPDVAAAGVEPWQHFLLHGRQEGRSPSAAFNVTWYRQRFPDLGDKDPWAHHLTHPDSSPVPLFDPQLHRLTMDPFVADVDPWIHYLVTGLRTTEAAPLFLPGWYRATYLAGHGDDADALLHYISNGWAANELPSPVIDPVWYTAQTRNELDPSLPAELHYAVHGIPADNRPSAAFDPAWYRQAHAVPADVAPVVHFHQSGYAQRLQTAPSFDVSFYLLRNPDVIGHDPWLHYARLGISEGRVGSAQQEQRWTRLAADVRWGESEVRFVLHHGEQERRVADVAQLEQALTGFELVTLDVWDTLITRPWPADSAKHHVARIMLHDLNSAGWQGSAEELVAMRGAAEFDLASQTLDADGNPAGEYTAAQAWTLLLQRALGEADPRLVERVIREEVTWESDLVAPVRAGLIMLEALRRAGVDTVLISDYYLPAQDLRAILSAAGVPVGELPLLVSCEEGASKRAGGLLQLVRERHHVAPEHHLHIGDSASSDVAPQVSSGGTALHLSIRAPWRPAPGHLTQAILFGSIHAPFDLGLPEPEVTPPGQAQQWNRLCGPQLRRSARLAAHPFGAIPAVLVLDAIDAAQEAGLHQVCYLSREGNLLKRVHEALPPTLTGDVDAVHLEVSRMSLFLASMQDFSFDEFQRMMRMYPLVSPRALADSLTLDPAERLPLEESARSAGVAWDAPFDWNDNLDTAMRILTGPNVESSLHAAKVRRRDAFMAYLDRRVVAGDGALVAVDLGWRGTIQDMLTLTADRPTIGQYLVLLGFLNPQSPSVTKRASLLDANAGDDVTWLDPHVAAVERLCTGPYPTTEGYTNDGLARLKQDLSFAVPGADNVMAGTLDGLVMGAVEYARRSASASFGREALRHAALSATRTIVERPPAPLVVPLGTQSHDETFGEGNAAVVGRLQRSWPAAASTLRRFVDL